MKKVIIKEFDRTLLGVDIMLYCVIAVIGYMILKFPEIELLNIMEYAPPLFYMFGFFALVAYFVNRRPNDYEYLFFGLINIIVGSFVLVNSYNPNSSFVLGTAILIYSILNFINKGYHTSVLMKEKNINLYPKMSITILLALLGVLIISNLYDKVNLQCLVLGYYFMTFGLISLFEPLLMIVIRNPKLEAYLVSLLEDDDLKVKKENKKVKKIKIEKPVIIEKKEETKVEIPKEEKIIKKKPTVKKKVNKSNKKNK